MTCRAQRPTHDAQRPDRRRLWPNRRAPTSKRRSQTFKISTANTRAPSADTRVPISNSRTAVSRPTAEVLGPTNRSFEGRRCGSELQRWSPEPGVAFRTLKEPPQAPAPTAVGIVPGKTQPRPSCKRRVMLYRALFVMTARKCARQPNVAPRKRSLWARYGKFIAGALP